MSTQKPRTRGQAAARLLLVVVVIGAVAGVYYAVVGWVRTTDFKVNSAHGTITSSTWHNVAIDAGWALIAVVLLSVILGGVRGISRGVSNMAEEAVGPRDSAYPPVPSRVTRPPPDDATQEERAPAREPAPAWNPSTHPDDEPDVVDAEVVLDGELEQEEPPPRPTVRHRFAQGETVFSVAADYYGDPSRWRDVLTANPELTAMPGAVHEGMEVVLPALPPGSVPVQQWQPASLPMLPGEALLPSIARLASAVRDAPAIAAQATAPALPGPATEVKGWPELDPLPALLPLDWMIEDPGVMEWCALVCQALAAEGFGSGIRGARVSSDAVEILVEDADALPEVLPCERWPDSNLYVVLRSLRALGTLATYNATPGPGPVLLPIGADDVGVVFGDVSGGMAIPARQPGGVVVALLSAVVFSSWGENRRILGCGFAPRGASADLLVALDRVPEDTVGLIVPRRLNDAERSSLPAGVGVVEVFGATEDSVSLEGTPWAVGPFVATGRAPAPA